MAAFRSILVIRLSSLGDVLFALPAVQLLRASGAAERVSWLVEDRAAGLLEHVDGLDEVVVYPRQQPRRWWAHARALRARRDDVVVDFQGNLKSRAQLALLKAPRKLGFDAPLAREGAERGLTERFLPSGPSRHRIAANVALLTQLGIDPPDSVPRPRLRWSEAARDDVDRELANAVGDGPLIVIHPGTSAFGLLKRWDPRRFAALADGLERPARVVITAGPGEESLAQAVASACVHPVAVIPPRGLATLTALLARAQLVVAADSFPLHLANALGTPVLGLYGPKDPAVTGPYFDRASVISARVACSPCTLRRCSDRICMERLALADVLAAAREQLAQAGAALAEGSAP